MNSFSITVHCCLAVLLMALTTNGSQARVSKSFVRGFLVGYAKGLEEGKNLVQLQPLVHSVACAFHPLPESEPEMHMPHHEPNHIGDHEPRHEPHHSHHSHHHEHGYSASTSHGSAAGQGLSSSSNIAASHVSPPQVNEAKPRVSEAPLIVDEKKVEATGVVDKSLKQPYKA